MIETVPSIKCAACGKEVGYVPPGSLATYRLEVRAVKRINPGEEKTLKAMQPIMEGQKDFCDDVCLKNFMLCN